MQHYCKNNNTDESQLAEIENEPVNLGRLLVHGEFQHFGDVVCRREDVVFQLDVIKTTRLGVHHQKGVVKVLLGPPSDSLDGIIQRDAHFRQVGIKSGRR